MPAKSTTEWMEWTRFVGMLLVACMHSQMSVDWNLSLQDYPIDGEFETRERAVFRFFLIFGMPAFFLFSGKTIYFNSKKSYKEMVIAKVKRLVIPYIIGWLVIVIPTCWVARSWKPGMPRDINNFFEFYWRVFSTFNWIGGWLWTLIALVPCFAIYFSYSKLLTELLERRRVTVQAFEYPLGAAWLIGLAVALEVFLSLPSWFTLFLGLPVPLFFAWYKLYSACRPSSLNLRLALLLIPQLIFPLVSLLQASFVELALDGIEKCQKYGCPQRVFTGWNMMFLAFGHGAFELAIESEWERCGGKSWEKTLRPFKFILVFLMMGITTSGDDFFRGSPFQLPHFRATWLQLISVVSIWTWMYFISMLFKAYFSGPFPQKQLQMSVNAVTVCYLFQWCFHDLFQYYVANPLKMDAFPNLIGGFTFSLGASYVMIFLIQKSSFFSNVLGIKN